MGAIALLVLAKGHHVTGSDLKNSQMIKSLKKQGAKIFLDHDAKNISGADCVVFSSAVKEDNPELSAARTAQIPIMQRAQLLAQLMEDQIGITVAGAHGKTTTSSIISFILLQAGLNPTTAVGGIIRNTDTNAILGDGQYFVSEVDESDGSFLYFKPKYSIITNIDFEHVDYYKNWDNILQAYRQFIGQTNPEGQIIACGEDEKLLPLLAESPCSVFKYGFGGKNDLSVRNVALGEGFSEFDCWLKGEKIGATRLNVPGEHNVLNALAGVALAISLGIDFDVIRQALDEYQGVQRRFQMKGTVNDVCIVDDYGHHPTEIIATLKAARTLNRKRIVTVFQPHRYSRTKFLMDQFVESLRLSDELIVTDIYAASEQVIEGVTAQVLLEKLQQSGFVEAQYVSRKNLLSRLRQMVQPGDLVITLGAGDIVQVGEELCQSLEAEKISANGS